MATIQTTLTTDVLIVGGGGAGVRAALEADRAGARVLLVNKGPLGKAGTTAFEVAEIAGYNAADGCADPLDTPEIHYRDIMAAALGTCDARLARILAAEAVATVAELESWGVAFEKKGDRHLAVEGCFATRPRMHIIKGHSKPILDAMLGRLRDTAIQTRADLSIVDLIVVDGRCRGALAMDESGALTGIDAGAVVLATGGAGQLFERNLNPPDVTGDGYAIALRAGAELVNLEFIQMGLGLVDPVANILNCWVWFLHPRLLNRDGREFLADYLPPGVDPDACMDHKATHFPFSSRDLSKYIEVAITKELAVGRGGDHGGVYLDFRNIDNAGVKPDFLRMWETTKSWLKGRGVDPDAQLLEVAPFGHAINGGLRVDENGETTARHLFAAGEAAGGPHGADRLGGNMIVGCQVFGKRAGRAAARAAAIRRDRRSEAEAFCRQSQQLLERFSGSSKSGMAPEAVKQAVQQLMSRNFLIVRNEQGLRQIIRETEALEARLAEDGLDRSGFQGPVAALECVNMLTLAKTMAGAALLRTESRGSHYREDFPALDPTWRGSVVSRLSGSSIVHQMISLE